METRHPAQGTVDAQTIVANAMTEDELLANVKDLATKLGWLFYHTRDARRSDEGFPDVCMVRNGRIIFAELKTEKGRTSPAQDVWLRELRVSSAEVWLFRPADWMAGLIEERLR